MDLTPLLSDENVIKAVSYLAVAGASWLMSYFKMPLDPKTVEGACFEAVRILQSTADANRDKDGKLQTEFIDRLTQQAIDLVKNKLIAEKPWWVPKFVFDVVTRRFDQDSIRIIIKGIVEANKSS